jgi:hypothetical protein
MVPESRDVTRARGNVSAEIVWDGGPTWEGLGPEVCNAVRDALDRAIDLIYDHTREV